MLNREDAILELTGSAGVYSYGMIVPGFWGRTTLQLQPTRLVEKTQKIIARRHCAVLLTQIDSVEIVEEGNPLLLTIGILTISLMVGFIFIILYFVLKNKYLAVRSGSNVQLVMLNSANTERAQQFMNAVLKQAEGLQPQR
ncbi:hypothetical protein [Chamaesiphon sp. OTE_8_metabat_110]|uniref:hypothetical protein n=1 Tax=Chamaesiphon sp. OTE_8_metabat_110 TaxID=2964696 RepID=UPI00286A0B3D|nr:hypothetical protein [Chamaesiphon sp. OTE_8_metabat_110]